MARTALTQTTAPGPFGSDGVAVTFTAADATNKNEFTMAGNDLLIVRNEDASSHNIVVTSAADAMGRTKDISEAIAAGVWKVYGPFRKLTGWQQSTGVLYLEADDANVEFAIIKLA